MEKDRNYYQQLAEDFYTNHFAEIKKSVDKENELKAKKWKEWHIDSYDIKPPKEDYKNLVLVDKRDDHCIFANFYSAAAHYEMIFSCSMEDGKLKTYLLDGGQDKLAEMLGLVDIYDKNERIDVEYVRKDDGALHLDLPKKLYMFSKRFYKVKLYDLDGFVSECNYAGWGDCSTQNILEVIAGLINQDCVDFENNEIYADLNWYVGPGEDNIKYYAAFEFSHCELAKDRDEDKGWAVYICYKYRGLEEEFDDD